jgi:hypothetical protein
MNGLTSQQGVALIARKSVFVLVWKQEWHKLGMAQWLCYTILYKYIRGNFINGLLRYFLNGAAWQRFLKEARSALTSTPVACFAIWPRLSRVPVKGHVYEHKWGQGCSFHACRSRRMRINQARISLRHVVSHATVTLSKASTGSTKLERDW